MEATCCHAHSRIDVCQSGECPVSRRATRVAAPHAALTSPGWPVAFATAGLFEVGGALLLESWVLLAEGMRQSLLGMGAIAMHFAKRLSARGPTERLSFGFGRAKVLVRLLMAVTGVGLSVALLILCLLHDPTNLEPSGFALPVLALFALAMGLQAREPARPGHAAGRLLPAFLSGPAIGALAAAGSLAWWGSAWWPADRIAAVLVLLAVGYGSAKAMWSPLCELMSACPQEVDMLRLERRVLTLHGVTCLHDLHVWSICGEQRWLSAHIGIGCSRQWPALQRELQHLLRHEFGIGHATLQPEPPEYRALATTRSRADIPLDDHSH